MEVKGRSFKDFMDSLATTHAQNVSLRTDFAFCDTNLIPDELRPEYRQFLFQWQKRFGLKKTVEGITTPGWYNLTVKACEGVRECVHANVEQISYWVRREWEELYPDDGDNAQVVALIEFDSHGLIIREVSAPMRSIEPMKLEHRCAIADWWVITDGNFSVEVGKPGSLLFQRAARAIENLGGSWDDTAIILEWIFAGGRENILKTADDVLSKRSSENTMSSLRRKIRVAMG